MNQWKDIRSALNNISQKDLTSLLGEMYKLNQQNQLFLETRFGKQTDKLEGYKNIIKKSICPDEPWKKDVSLSQGRRAIEDYKKALGETEELIDLMIYYCECGVLFTNTFGDIDEHFYSSVESMYESVLDILKKHNQFKSQFFSRIEKIVHDTDGIGWGFHDNLEANFELYKKTL